MLRIFKITVTTLVAFIIIFVFTTTAKSMGTRESRHQAKMHYLTIKGSDTMVHLTSEWAEAFMNDYPEMNVSVTGGGSGTGIAALINGTTDICIASREIKEDEKRLAEQKGISPVELPVAQDAIAVIVNPDNPVNELTMEQMKEIFSGAASNWNHITGGLDRPIFVLSRESSSGTYVFFQERVLSKLDYTHRARLMPGTSAVVQNVSADMWSIGYVGLGYALEAIDQVKIIRVKIDEKSPPVIPSEESARKAEYPIARLLYFYTNGNPQGLVKKFIEFCLSNKGQKIVSETGYVKID
jgi:phosphate transport system substrate-binding protein